MSSPRKPRLAARIFPPPIPPRSHSNPSQPRPCNPNITTDTPNSTSKNNPITIQKLAPAAVSSHRRSDACESPIVWNNRDEKSGRQQTEESEKATAAAARQGIKVRDFQVEVDEKRFEEARTGVETTELRYSIVK